MCVAYFCVAYHSSACLSVIYLIELRLTNMMILYYFVFQVSETVPLIFKVFIDDQEAAECNDWAPIWF